MQYTESSLNGRKGKEEEECRPNEWQATFAGVNDRRRKQGQRYSLSAIVVLAMAAILSNHVSELAIAEWGASQSEEVKRALGFQKGVTPPQSTIHRLFRRLHEEEVEAAFRQFFQHVFAAEQPERGTWAVAIDGKAQRGRLPFEAQGAYPMHAVSIVDHQTGIVLTQGPVERTEPAPKTVLAKAETQSQTAQTEEALPATKQPRTKKPKRKPTEDQDKKEQEEQKMKSELAVAALLVKQIEWRGKVLTGDGLYCQRCLCHTLHQAGGDSLFLGKGNQPQLFEDIRLLFAPVEPATRAGEGILRLPAQHAQIAERGHGRTELRRIRVSSELKDYSDWPWVAQVFEIRRGYQSKGQWREAVRSGVTSLPATLAIPERLLKVKRGHWVIENRLHYVKDVTMGEDRSTIHADHEPKIMAALRNTVVSLLRRAGFSTIAARMRYNSLHPQAALQILSLSLAEYA